MSHLPRIAVGTIQAQARREPVLFALLAALHAEGFEPALFRAASCLAAHDPARSLTGSGSRHLDSWAMTRSGCLRTIARAGAHAGVGIVEGAFDRAAPPLDPDSPRGSSLDTLCDWLDLPRIAVVDVSRLDPCRVPRLAGSVEAILLDRARDAAHAGHWQVNLEALWRAPVLGWLDEAESLRSLCETLPAGRDPSPELCAALARRLAGNLRLDKLLALADRWPLPKLPADDLVLDLQQRPLRIALAYDEDYCGYFPDTLDLLEASGAELCDFSPLRSGALPDGADVVYFGCGHPERRPDVLARNHCLQQSLRSFAAAGGRIYAEGSGMAYLCREIVLPCGSRHSMTGLLPAVAHLADSAGPAEPVEVTFGADSWMVDVGTVLRGYRHPGWRIEPRGPLVTYAQDPRQRFDILGRGNVIGSRVLINLAANEHLLKRFAEPAEVVLPQQRRQP
jgi:cobyrinic acid a,c-diamide synthase